MIVSVRPEIFMESNIVTRKNHIIEIDKIQKQFLIIDNIIYLNMYNPYSNPEILFKTNEKIELLVTACFYNTHFRHYFMETVRDIFPKIKDVKILGNPVIPLCFNSNNVTAILFSFLKKNNINIKTFLLDSRYAIVVDGFIKKKVRILDLSSNF